MKTKTTSLEKPIPVAPKLTIVIPCFNEEKTLNQCVERVLMIADENLRLEIIIVDDASIDKSYFIARNLENKHRDIRVIRHDLNQGKGAALRTGFRNATGDFTAVQDADLEYDPMDLKSLLIPLINSEADVVLGSRFLSASPHRVLCFWHCMGNRFLTFLSNMFTDLNLTDMETCYKVFRTDILKQIDIKENRFGFEPEIVAKVAHMRLRVYEMGISYHERTYEEGKKIGLRDGLRALYCIFLYNAHKAPLPIRFMLYLFIGGFAAAVNLIFFLISFHAGWDIIIAVPTAFILAAFVNCFLCILILFRRQVKWKTPVEILLSLLVVSLIGIIDLTITKLLLHTGIMPTVAKLTASAVILLLNFAGIRFLIFPEHSSGP